MGKEEAYRLIAACFESLDVAEALVSENPGLLQERTGLGETPLHYLAVEDQREAVELLHRLGAEIDVVSDVRSTPLIDALALGYVQMSEYLLRSGADVHASGSSTHETALHAAVSGGRPELVRAVLAAGAPLDRPNDLGETPLHAAIQKKSLDIARILIDSGANVNARRIFYQTPLHVAAEQLFLDGIELLLAHGADRDALDANGATPADVADNLGRDDLAARIRGELD